jgi:hypothetical protein
MRLPSEGVNGIRLDFSAAACADALSRAEKNTPAGAQLHINPTGLHNLESEMPEPGQRDSPDPARLYFIHLNQCDMLS